MRGKGRGRGEGRMQGQPRSNDLGLQHTLSYIGAEHYSALKQLTRR